MHKYWITMVDISNPKNKFAGTYWGTRQHEATRDARRDFAQKLGLPDDDVSVAKLKHRLKVENCTKI